MSHQSANDYVALHGVPEPTRRAQGISDNLVRLSVGIEAAEDIIADLGQALEAA